MSTAARGFKNVVIAQVLKNTENEFVCGEPIKLFPAVSGKITLKRNSEKLYADDDVDEIIDSFDTADIELEGTALSNKLHSLIYGSKLENGILVEKTTDTANEVAIAFMVKTKGGYNFHWYPCGKFSDEDSDEYETKKDKISPKNKTLKGTFYGRKRDQVVRIRVNEEELLETDADAKTAMENWFKAVPGQTSSPSTKIEVEYSDYTTGDVTDISLSGVTFDTSSKKFINVPAETATFTFNLDGTEVTATLSGSTWTFA